MNDRFQELSVFVRTAATGSFSATGRELGLSQSSVSRIISELESRLSVRLLLRSTRKVALTDAGEVFLEQAMKILADLERADELARNIDSLDGILRVALPSIVCNRILVPNLSRFTAEHPQLKIEFMASDSLQDLVTDRADIAIRFGRLKDSSFVARRLASLPRVLIASPAYVAARGQPESVDQLTGHDMIVGPVSPQVWPWTFNRQGQSYHARITPRFHFDSTDCALTAAMSGLGIARVVEVLCGPELQSGRLLRILPEYAPDPLDLSAVYPAGRSASQKVKLFSEFLKTLFDA